MSSEIAQYFLDVWVLSITPALLGAIIGLTIADIDLWPTLPIAHRSAWTHGPLVPLGAWASVAMTQNEPFYWFALGLCPAFALHCAFDLFPKRWAGSALIHCKPVPLRLNSVASFLWLALGVGAGLWVSLAMAPVEGVGAFLALGLIAWAMRGYVVSEFKPLPLTAFLGLLVLSYTVQNFVM